VVAHSAPWRSSTLTKLASYFQVAANDVSTLQQKIKITGPSVVTANRTFDGVVTLSDRREGLVEPNCRMRRSCVPPTKPARCSPNRSRDDVARDRRLISPGQIDESGEVSPEIYVNISAVKASPIDLRPVSRKHLSCMHNDEKIDRTLINETCHGISPIQGRAPSVRRTHRGRIQVAAAD